MIKKCFIATLMLSVPHLVAAEQPNIEPGEWEYTNVTTFQGPMQMPDQRIVERECVTLEDLQQGEAFLAEIPDECQVSNMRIERDGMSYTMACAEDDAEMVMDVDMTFNGTRLSGNVSSTVGTPMGEMKMNVGIDGQRVGSC
jgi:hypothetical protein